MHPAQVWIKAVTLSSDAHQLQNCYIIFVLSKQANLDYKSTLQMLLIDSIDCFKIAEFSLKKLLLLLKHYYSDYNKAA